MKIIIIIAVVITGYTGFAQNDIKAVLDSSVNRIQRISLYTNNINWDSLKPILYSKAANAKAVSELKPAFETLLNALKDFHGRILNAKDYSTLAYFTDYANLHHPDTRLRDPEIWKAINSRSSKFEYSILDKQVGYLKIVGYAPNVDITAETQKIRTAVIELSKKKIDRWIIDLRFNGGGNMYPMMGGIGPLIGDGIVGKLVGINDDTLFNWTISNGNFVYDVPGILNLPNEPVFDKLPRIAVLTCRWTVSSGEVVAASLKGRPHTRFFGEATGGMTTNTSWENISNEIILNISTGVFCDRNGNIYHYNIPVDEEAAFDPAADPANDKGIIAAQNWLLKNE